MGKYKIEIKKSVYKEIAKLPSKDIKIILSKIESLSDNPRPVGVQKLSIQEKYRVRCGIYRILYKIEDDILVIIVVKVGHRRDVYKRIP